MNMSLLKFTGALVCQPAPTNDVAPDPPVLLSQEPLNVNVPSGTGMVKSDDVIVWFVIESVVPAGACTFDV